jgi:hypothetical protein
MPPLTRFRVSRLLICLLIALLPFASMPMTANVQDLGDTGTPIAADAPVIDGPAAPEGLIVEPTQIPPEPTPEPTSEDIQPAPTDVPTETPPTPIPPTPTPLPNTDTLSAISPVDPVTLQQGESHTLELVYAVTTPRIATVLHAELRAADGSLATGWVLAEQGTSGTGPAFDKTESNSVTVGSSFAILLSVSAPPEVITNETVQLHIRSTEVMDAGETATPVTGDTPLMTITVVPPPTPVTADFALSCDTSIVAAAVGEQPVTVTCTVTGLESLGEREATLSQVVVTAPAGWDVSGAGTILTLNPGTVIGTGSGYDASFSIAPVACDATSGSVTITSELLYLGVETVTGPAASVEAKLIAPQPSMPQVDLSFLGFSGAVWNGSDYAPATGTLAMTITPTGTSACPAPHDIWALQVSTSGLYADGDSAIHAESITYLGTQSAAEAPAGLEPVASDIPLMPGQPVTVAYVEGSAGTGGTWNAQFLLTPPDDVPPGTYGGEFDVTIISAP